MDINNIQGVNNQSPTVKLNSQKTHDTEFCRELGRDALGTGLEGRSLVKNITPEEAIRMLKQDSKIELQEIDLAELTALLKKYPEKIKYIKDLGSIKNISGEELKQTLKENDTDKLDLLPFYKKAYEAINPNGEDEIYTLSNIISSIDISQIKKFATAFSIAEGIDIDTASCLMELDIDNKPKLAEFVRAVPENLRTLVDYNNWEMYALEKKFPEKAQLLSEKIADGTGIYHSYVNGFLKSSDAVTNIQVQLLNHKTNLPPYKENGHIPNAFDFIEGRYSRCDTPIDEIEKRFNLFKTLENITYKDSENNEHSLIQDIYANKPDILYETYSWQPGAVNILNELSKYTQDEEIGEDVQRILKNDAGLYLQRSQIPDFKIDDLINHIKLSKKIGGKVELFHINSNKITQTKTNAELLDSVGILDTLKPNEITDLKIESPEKIKEFIENNKDLIEKRGNGVVKLLIKTLETNNPKKISYLENYVLRPNKNIPVEDLEFELDTPDDIQLYTNGLVNQNGEHFPINTFNYSVNKRAAESYKELAESGLDTKIINTISNNLKINIDEKIDFVKEVQASDLNQETKLYLLAKGNKQDFEIAKYISENCKDLDDNVKATLFAHCHTIGQVDLFRAIKGNNQYSDEEGYKLIKSVYNDEHIPFAISILSNKNKKYSDSDLRALISINIELKNQKELIDSVLKNDKLSMDDFMEMLYYIHIDETNENGIPENKLNAVKQLIKNANKNNIYLNRNLIVLITNANKDIDLDNLLKLADGATDKDTFIIDAVKESIQGNLSLANLINVSKELEQQKININGKTITLKDYIPKDTLVEIVNSASNKNGTLNQNYIDTAISLIKEKNIGYKYIPQILNVCKSEQNEIDKTIYAKAIRLNQKGMRDNVIATTINSLKDKDGNIVQEAFDKIVNLPNIKDLSKSDSELFTFLKFSKADGLYNLTKTEKKDFLMQLLLNKSNLQNNHLKQLISLLPTNDKEYASVIQSITQSLNMSSKALDDNKQKEFDTNINIFAETLKTLDLSDLSDIQLTMPHSEFVSKVNNIIENLPKAEQAKIQDYFGFKIINKALTGYPNSTDKDFSVSEIENPQTIEALNKVKTIVDNYTNNNFITVKDNPILNEKLKSISKYMPEIFNQVGTNGDFVDTIKSLQKIVQNPKYETLSDSDKKVMLMSTLLHKTDKVSGSTAESAFDAYFIAKRFNFTDKEAQKLYKVIESSDLINKFMNTTKEKDDSKFVYNNRQDIFNLLSFKLKEDNNFELAQMLYSTKEKEGLTRFLDKALAQRINEIKGDDFVLPQTEANEYKKYSEEMVIERGDNTYSVQVADSCYMPNFYALIHTPEAGFSTGGTRIANFANFDIFKDFADDKVICTSYISSDKAGLVKQFHNGFIFDVDNDKQYVGYSTDIYSIAKDIPNMLKEYYSDNGTIALRGRGEKYQHRSMISNELKRLLGINNDNYIQRLDNIKSKLNGSTMTLDKLEEIDPDFASAYKILLSRDRSNIVEGSLLNSTYHNEILVSNPKIVALFTDNIETIPEDYLEKAQTEGLPIVIIRTN